MSGNRSRAHSIIQLVIGITVGVVVFAVALLALARAREEARATRCRSILEDYGVAFTAYAEDFGGVLPYENIKDEALGFVVWYDGLASYMVDVDRVCPSVDRSSEYFQEGYRMNSKLSRRSAIPPQPYCLLSSLPNPASTVVLFDAEYGGRKLSMKGRLKDADFRHNGSVNILFADWQVKRFDERDLMQASNWLPPKVIWDPH